MDKLQRKLVMSKFFNKGKVAKSSTPSVSPKAINPIKDENNGFYETLVMKKKSNIQQSIKKDAEICKKMGTINGLIKKKYMIPSQFPNITQAHSN